VALAAGKQVAKGAYVAERSNANSGMASPRLPNSAMAGSDNDDNEHLNSDRSYAEL